MWMTSENVTSHTYLEDQWVIHVIAKYGLLYLSQTSTGIPTWVTQSSIPTLTLSVLIEASNRKWNHKSLIKSAEENKEIYVNTSIVLFSVLQVCLLFAKLSNLIFYVDSHTGHNFVTSQWYWPPFFVYCKIFFLLPSWYLCNLPFL